MSLAIRNYQLEEADLACDVRGLENIESRDRFKKRLENPGEWIDHYLHMALTRNEKLIGDIQFRHCDKTMPTGTAHIGIDIAEAERGRGAGTAALELAWTWAEANGFHRIEGSTSIKNIAMRRAFEKAGWEFEGTIRKLFMANGVAEDYLSFSKTS